MTAVAGVGTIDLQPRPHVAHAARVWNTRLRARTSGHSTQGAWNVQAGRLRWLQTGCPASGGSGHLADGVVAAERIGHPKRALGVVAPFPIDQEPVVIRPRREVDDGRPHAAIVLAQINGLFLPVREIADELHAARRRRAKREGLRGAAARFDESFLSHSGVTWLKLPPCARGWCPPPFVWNPAAVAGSSRSRQSARSQGRKPRGDRGRPNPQRPETRIRGPLCFPLTARPLSWGQSP